MTKARGTLSSRGWLLTPEARLDRLMTEYMVANPSQSLFYYGKVRSFISTINRVGKDPDRLASAIQSDLTEAAMRCFPENQLVEVSCTTDDYGVEVTINIAITVYENGVAYELNRVLSTTNSSYVNLTGAQFE